MRFAASEGRQSTRVDGTVAAPGDGEVLAQVGKAQVVGCGQPAQVSVGGLAAVRAGTDRERRSGAAVVPAHDFPLPGLPAWEAMSTGMVSMDLRVIFSVPSMTAWMAAERISQSKLPIIPLVRWCR